MKCFSRSGKEIELGSKITWYSWRYKGMVVGLVDRMEMRTLSNWYKDDKGGFVREAGEPKKFIKLSVWVDGTEATTKRECYRGRISKLPEFAELY
jgi:hypothetical protein